MSPISKNIYNQGFHKTTSNQPYFEGFYYKFVNEEGEMIVVIAGISFSKTENHAFIQVASNKSSKAYFYKFPLSEFDTNGNTFNFSIGENIFSNNTVKLSLPDVNGEIKILNRNDWKRSWWSPSIMGFLSYIPNIECKHDVLTTNSMITGAIDLNNKKTEFKSGKGYIEKNWGQSFPKEYVWGHANQFKTKSLSVQFALAKPKWLVFRPSVYIGYVKYNGSVTHFGTHHFSHLSIQKEGEYIIITIRRIGKKIILRIKLESPIDLVSPKDGELINVIKEYMNSSIQISIFTRNVFGKLNELIVDKSLLATTEFHNYLIPSK
ncbi:MAG: tocopherol cyclase family protein [Brumimicrobium sp.]